MGLKYQKWQPRSHALPHSLDDLKEIIFQNRNFNAVDSLEYGDFGLDAAYQKIIQAIQQNKRIALYADYDVDGTMSCVAWLWFLRAVGHQNHIYYIPDRFREGYGVNLAAIQRLVQDERAEVVITMDTGITANIEAAWCRENGVDFICTDHHKIQLDKMPDSIILNPKLHPDENYQELCGCGITFVLLRKIGRHFNLPIEIWHDLLAITGIATICDIVPLNAVNHRLARLGIEAIKKSKRAVFKKMLEAIQISDKADEKDVGFRIGPRINAVGRLEHASMVVEAFLHDDPTDLIKHMGLCNDRRKQIQSRIIEEAQRHASKVITSNDEPSILFLGGDDWHQGVVGIAASRIAEDFWRPTWLFHRTGEICKGSARSIPGFDVTEAMASCGHLFKKFGGHRAAGGFAFKSEDEMQIRHALNEYGKVVQKEKPFLWQSSVEYDCQLPWNLGDFQLTEVLSSLKPFGNSFDEPKFLVEGKLISVQFYKDKVSGVPKHTALNVLTPENQSRKIMFFNRVVDHLNIGQPLKSIVTVENNIWNGTRSLQWMGVDVSR